MKRISKKPKQGQLNPADRLSALPDNVAYNIVSFLGFKDACRISILSKRWKYVSDTNPVMELSNEVFSAKPGRADAHDKIDDFLKYVETRMKRYSKQKLNIKKLTLGFPIQRMTFRNTKVPLENKAEQWVEIAVRNQVEELVLVGPKNYELSHILFTATSLRRLDCTCLEIYDFKGIAGFPSLESLFLDEVYVKDAILNRIISSSPLLKHLRMVGCSGTSKSIKSIVIPCNSKLETFDLRKSLSIDEAIVTIDSSSLTSFQYIGDSRESRDGGVTGVRVQLWPVISKDGSLRNLKILKIGFVSITDEVLGKLLSELVLLETLKLCNCSMLKTIRIISTLLKDFRAENCCDLLDVNIDAPCLETFKYKGDCKLSMSINTVAGCDMSFHVPPSAFYPHRVWKLMRLIRLSNRHVLKIVLPEKPRKPNQIGCPDIDLDDMDFNEKEPDEEELARYFRPPCDIRELKLNLSTWKPFYSSLSGFIHGVFWICHPRILSLRVNLRASNTSVESLIRELKEMADSCEHPLRSFEIEGTNYSGLLEARKGVLDIRLKLHW